MRWTQRIPIAKKVWKNRDLRDRMGAANDGG